MEILLSYNTPIFLSDLGYLRRRFPKCDRNQLNTLFRKAPKLVRSIRVLDSIIRETSNWNNTPPNTQQKLADAVESFEGSLSQAWGDVKRDTYVAIFDPTFVNDSAHSVFVKPEYDTDGPCVEVKPGGVYGPIDGFAVPSIYPGHVFKVIDGLSVRVTAANGVQLFFFGIPLQPLFDVNQAAGGGWKGGDFLTPATSNWAGIFHAANTGQCPAGSLPAIEAGPPDGLNHGPGIDDGQDHNDHPIPAPDGQHQDGPGAQPQPQDPDNPGPPGAGFPDV